MVAFNKYEVTVTDIAAGNHANTLNADTDVCKVALTNTAPNAATHLGLANITEITAGNGYTAGGEDAANAATTATGTITVAGTDITWTASGGSINQFRYCVLYNDTSAGDDLLGWWDNGSAVDLATGESFTLNFGASMFTVS
jgi:hypothetical protein